MSDRSEIEWAPRVSLSKIRELYEREACGEHTPEELLERYAWWRGQKPIARRKDLGDERHGFD